MFSLSKILLLVAIIIVVLYGAKLIQSATGRRDSVEERKSGREAERAGKEQQAIEADLVRCSTCGVFVDPKTHVCPGPERPTG